MNDVLLASTRHLSVIGRSDADAIRLMDGWLDMMKWHLASFWHIEHSKNSVYPNSDGTGKALFSGDHAKFSGEMIAEGISVKVMELLGHGTNNFYFYPSSNTASPDFVLLDPSEQADTAIIKRDGTRVALESRCRKYPFRFKRGERANLNRKKAGFSEVLAVYFVHAPSYIRAPKEMEGLQRTKVLLIDPKGKSKPARRELIYEAAISHYQEVCRRIGLHGEVEILESMRKNLATELNKIARSLSDPQFISGEPIRNVGDIVKKIDGHEFVGRDFNDILKRKSEIDTAELLHRIKSQDFGPIRYYGLAQEVVSAIRRHDYLALTNPTSLNLTPSSDRAIGMDGTILVDRNPDASEIKYFVQQFQNEIDSVRRRR